MELAWFDTPVNRRGTDCSKWDAIPYPVEYSDVIPMWVADMDFCCPPAVIEIMRERLSHPLFGYMQLPLAYHQSIIDWHKVRYNATVLKEDIVPIASVLGGVAMAVQAFTQPGEAVLVPTPGYHAFYNTVNNNQRRLVAHPLCKTGDHYAFDLEALERQIVAEDVKLLLFCSPHNPTGRIWSGDELHSLIEICYRHQVVFLSDEIHADMTLGKPFTTVFSASERASAVSVALYAPTKSFNLAGLCTAYAVIKSQKLSEQFQKAVAASGLKVKNTLGTLAMIGAYEGGAPWLDTLQTYLLENHRFAVEYIQTQIPALHAYVPEATYFLWVDFSGTGLTGQEISERCIHGAHLAFTQGRDFIAGGEQFMRINCACQRTVLKAALERLSRTFS